LICENEKLGTSNINNRNENTLFIDVHFIY